MAPTSKLTVIKSFKYRTMDEEWSNSYHFETNLDSDATFQTQVAALIDLEKTCYGAQVKVVRAYGYAHESEQADYVKDYSAAPILGTLVAGGGGHRDLPGDCAATVRWGTNTFTSRGKRIYLRKYFHGAWGEPGTDVDELHHGQRDAMAAMATTLEGADPIGLGAYVSATGTPVIGHKVAPEVTIRQLKRRGKRPLASP